MDERDRASLQAAVLAVLAHRIAEAQEQAKKRLLNLMGAGDRLNPTLGGVRLAAVSKSRGGEGPARAAITDPKAYFGWVREHHPDEIVTVVRESFTARLLNTSAVVGRACSPDGVLDVPGVTVTGSTKDPYISVRPTPEAVSVIADYWQQGRLMLDGTLREIEATPDAPDVAN